MNYLKRMLRGHGIITLIIVFFISGMTWASDPTMFYKLQLKPEKPDDTWALRTFNDAGTQVFEIDEDGRIIEAANETTVDHVSIPLTSFTINGAALTALTTDDVFVSEDDVRIGTINGNQAIVWGAKDSGGYFGNSNKYLEATVRVPQNYYQNGKIYAKVRSNEPNHVASVDWAARRHTNTTLDTVDSVETAVALTASPAAATVAKLTFDPESEDDSFAADNWVTFKVRRTPNVHGFNANLEFYEFYFEYERQY
uniref:Uncharacterized protein n=1 Tax=viral metagenome TaxID=1070528 RepID=A0A6M3KXJ8_9ZZZZ